MKKILLSAVLVPVFAVGFAATDVDSAAAKQKETDSKHSASYDYTAQNGDSYTVLARKAVQTYGINENINLSLAEILAAETNLTQTAGQPLLVVGQTVKVSKAEVKDAIVAAQKMSDGDETAWATYVPFVASWDTRNNG